MASKLTLDSLKTTIQALAEKYEVPPTRVKGILEEVPDDILPRLDWKDLDALVQEGLVEPGYADEDEMEELKGGFF